jgi:tetratricopeptide (TPR) repeat protein
VKPDRFERNFSITVTIKVFSLLANKDYCCFNGTVQDSSFSSQTIINRLSYWVVLTATALAPLLVIPVFTNFMVTSKLLIISVSAILLLGLFIFHTVKNRVLEVPRSPLVPGLLLFGLLMLLSSLLTTSYPVENILGMGGALIGFSLIAVLGSLLIKGRPSQDFMRVFNVTVVILGVMTLLQTIGFGPTRLINSLLQLNIPNTGLFSLTGSPFVAIQVFGLALLANAADLLKRRKTEILSLVTMVAATLGFILSLMIVRPGGEAAPLLLPFGVSWTIAVDVLKAPRSALIGVGPENYAAAYQQLRPVWINGTSWWNTTFGQASNVPLTLMTTTGLLGLGAWVLVTLKTLGYARTHFKQEPALVALIVGSIILQLALPANMVTLSLMAGALAFLIANRPSRTNVSIHLFKVEKRDQQYDVPAQASHPAVLALPFVMSGLVVLVGLYGVGRAYAASYAFFQSSLALQTNDAVKTYELQQQATTLNPYLPLFRSNFALTNLAIATALSNKTDASEEDQQQVAALIQQSIREARAATLLRPEDSQTWQALGQIYRSLIGSADGADQWATSAYVQAISTNPNDPLLRIELGGLLYGLQQYADANLLFQQAAELKPDLPNAYYNLANGLRSAGQLEQARLAYQKTLSLLTADSDDYTRANQELEELEALIEETAAETGDTTTPPASQNQTSAVPSIVNQNVSEPNEDVVNQPSSTPLSELNVEQPAPTPVVSPSP